MLTPHPTRTNTHTREPVEARDYIAFSLRARSLSLPLCDRPCALLLASVVCVSFLRCSLSILHGSSTCTVTAATHAKQMSVCGCQCGHCAIFCFCRHILEKFHQSGSGAAAAVAAASNNEHHHHGGAGDAARDADASTPDDDSDTDSLGPVLYRDDSSDDAATAATTTRKNNPRQHHRHKQQHQDQHQQEYSTDDEGLCGFYLFFPVYSAF